MWRAKEYLKSYIKQLLLKKLLRFVAVKILAFIATVGWPFILLFILFVIIYSTFFDLPNEYQANQGALGFFTTGDSEWDLNKDKDLMKQYMDYSDNGYPKVPEMDFGSKIAYPYTPSQHDQASEFKLPWSLLAAADRMFGDPMMPNRGDKVHRKPNPEFAYKLLGPWFKWKDSTVTVTVCDKKSCSTENYNVKLLTEANQYDKLNKLNYQWETFSPSKGVTVTHEKLTGIDSEPYGLTRLQAFMLLNSLPKDDDQFALELANRYDTMPLDVAANPYFDTNWSGTGDGANVPPQLVPIYKAAAQKYGIPWNVLAAINYVETDFGRDVSTSSAGAIGFMQFLPSTWAEFAVDGNGDGIADPYNPADAIFTAAHYLSASMGADKNIRRAIFAYNHADWYVNKVLAYANLFSGNTVANGTTGNAKKIIDTAYTFVGKVYYQLGGGRTEHDMNQNIFDCSSYVWRVFQLNGMTLGPLTDVNTKSLDRLGVEVPPSQIRAGDLIFFNTDGVDGHVGIYVGSGKFIGAQDSGCYVADVNWWANHYGLGHIRRILNG